MLFVYSDHYKCRLDLRGGTLPKALFPHRHPGVGTAFLFSEEVKNEIKQIIIDEEFKGLMPPLAPDEYKLLEESIKTEGCREPIILWHTFLIDGYTRYEICQKNNIKYKTNLKPLMIYIIGIRSSCGLLRISWEGEI